LAPKVLSAVFNQNGLPFIYYEEGRDAAFCHTCVMAVKIKRMKSNYLDPAFVSN
jgi:hypothetical protein